MEQLTINKQFSNYKKLYVTEISKKNFRLAVHFYPNRSTEVTKSPPLIYLCTSVHLLLHKEQIIPLNNDAIYLSSIQVRAIINYCSIILFNTESSVK